MFIYNEINIKNIKIQILNPSIINSLLSNWGEMEKIQNFQVVISDNHKHKYDIKYSKQTHMGSIIRQFSRTY